MKRLLPYLLLLAAVTAHGQLADTISVKPNSTTRFGVKGGVKSSIYLISEFTIDGKEILEVQNNYKIGYFAAVFMRVNFDSHFIQPEISYNINRCEITFNKNITNAEATVPDYATIYTTVHSAEVPILYGYNFVKKGPYGMSLFVGPKIKYIWRKQSKIGYENFDQGGISEDIRPFNIGGAMGVSVNISRIFFDFRYEQSILNTSRKMNYTFPEDGGNSIILKRRDSVISFSLGFLF
jgi:hypothetical protein